MPIVPLHFYLLDTDGPHSRPAPFLSVITKVMVGGNEFSKPVSFVIDTAAQRTVISSRDERAIVAELNPKLKKADEPAQTLWGETEFETPHDLTLFALATNQKSVDLTRKVPVSFWRHRRSRWPLAPKPRELEYNLLGADVLCHWTLYDNRHRRIAFLARDDGDKAESAIHDSLKGCSILAATFKVPPPVTPATMKWIH